MQVVVEVDGANRLDKFGAVEDGDEDQEDFES